MPQIIVAGRTILARGDYPVGLTETTEMLTDMLVLYKSAADYLALDVWPAEWHATAATQRFLLNMQAGPGIFAFKAEIEDEQLLGLPLHIVGNENSSTLRLSLMPVRDS